MAALTAAVSDFWKSGTGTKGKTLLPKGFRDGAYPLTEGITKF